MATLLVEIGTEELPAGACYEADAQLRDHVRSRLGLEPTQVFVSPRRIAFLVEDVPETTAPTWVSGPPVGAPEQAKEGFARKHGVSVDALGERDGKLGVELPGRALADVVRDELDELVYGLSFSKSMRWRADGRRFSRPVRSLLVKLDDETLVGEHSFGRRFTGGAVEIPTATGYADALRAAGVEPDANERRRLIVEAFDRLGTVEDPLGKLDEVVHMTEWPVVLEATFDERFLGLPRSVVETAMQSHQRYFPLGENRFAVVAAGGDPEAIVPGYVRVLEGRLDDALFTFERDLVAIDSFVPRLSRITFFEGAGTLADKTERLVSLVRELGGQEEAVEAAGFAKADQASELVREFPTLQGVIGEVYARYKGFPVAVCQAIAEQYLPEGPDSPLPTSDVGKILSAADKIDTLTTSFGLGHRPTGSRDPYGLRRAAIGLCRLAVDGDLTIPRSLLDPDVRDFVEERLEGLLDVPVELVRAARAADVATLGEVAGLASWLSSRDLATVHEVYTRARRIVGEAVDDEEIDETLLADEAERELVEALREAPPEVASHDDVYDWAAALAPVVERFFTDVLVMVDDERLRANRLRILRDVRDGIGRLGDLSQIPL
jgi:glycyl-tRNA synthetase beta chain